MKQARRSGAFVLAFLATAGATSAWAGGCATGPNAKTPEQVAEAIVSLPNLISTPSRPSPQIVGLIHEVVAANPANAAIVLDLTKGSDPRIIRLVASGLAMAAAACAASQPDLALQIQQAIVTNANAELVQTFQSATNDVRTAAVEASVANSPVVIGPAGTPGGGGAFGGGSFRAPVIGRAGGADQPVNLFNNTGRAGGSSVTINRTTSPAR